MKYIIIVFIIIVGFLFFFNRIDKENINVVVDKNVQAKAIDSNNTKSDKKLKEAEKVVQKKQISNKKDKLKHISKTEQNKNNMDVNFSKEDEKIKELQMAGEYKPNENLSSNDILSEEEWDIIAEQVNTNIETENNYLFEDDELAKVSEQTMNIYLKRI
jgi:hypothetical protein